MEALEKLIAPIADGDRRAMQELYRLTYRYLAGVAQRYVDNNEDVKDVLQEGYLHIFEHINQFSPQEAGSLRGWMTRIVVNESLRLLRHKARWDWIETRNELPDIIDEDELETDQIPIAQLHNFIRKLPPGYRTVLNLYVFEEKSHKEIAQLLGIKEKTSASQYYHAKALLRQWIEDYLNYPLNKKPSNKTNDEKATDR
ncbi:MAG: sigma-70 family RNA polymerase sigma factor [Bacteroidales bacterium]|nr:sigma-70 family RNA polymerase sigma factor [Bacteroidales bacterium]